MAFNFLITTDNHVGYRENDHIRRKDSYMAFKEALEIARNRDVDFILLGGDLFHVNRPSPSIEHKCIKIIRQHMNVQADRDVSFRRVQGQFDHFHKLNHANFEDESLKVPYPILTIHGNHDDPVGPNGQSVCAKLATCGLINYFGLVTSEKKVVVEPIVLQKGQIKIALYGMGFIPDYKLMLAFDKGEVIFAEPPNDTFNILVVHQNRVPLNKNKYVPDEFYPTFFHLIIRGHEHNTQSPEPIPKSKVNGYVYQPGSTVSTSISTMEAGPKKVGIISVKPNNLGGDHDSLYKMEYELIELQCCRKMLLRDISQKEISRHLKSVLNKSKTTSVEYKKLSKKYVEDCINGMLEANRSQAELKNSNSQRDKMYRFDMPLVRVRLEYITKNERFDELDISALFYPDRVANKDVVLFKKQKIVETDSGEIKIITFLDETNDEEEQDDFKHIDLDSQKRDTIDFMIENYFKDQPTEMQLQALSLNEYTNAVKGSGEDGNVISKVLSKKKQEVFNKFKLAIADEETARLNFHDTELVRDWFLRAFRG